MKFMIKDCDQGIKSNAAASMQILLLLTSRIALVLILRQVHLLTVAQALCSTL